MATRPSPTRAGPVLASLPWPSLPAPKTLAVVPDPHLASDAYRLDAEGRRPGRADADGGAP